MIGLDKGTLDTLSLLVYQPENAHINIVRALDNITGYSLGP